MLFYVTKSICKFELNPKKTKRLEISKKSLKKKSKLFQKRKKEIKKSHKLFDIFHFVTELIDIYSDLKAETQINNFLELRKKLANPSKLELESEQESYEIALRKLESELRGQKKVKTFH